MNHGTAKGYKAGCRCDDCRAYNRRTVNAWRERQEIRPQHRDRNGNRIDDGVIDPVVIERLLAGIDVPSTRSERLEAARIAYGREGWHDLCKRLGINSARARQITREVSA